MGDISETIEKFFIKSEKIIPQQESSISLSDVDVHLSLLETKTKEDEQTETIINLTRLLTPSDLKMVNYTNFNKQTNAIPMFKRLSE